MAAVGGADQLRGHPKPRSGAPDAALEHMVHAQRLGDAPDVLMLTFERKSGSSGNHLEAGELCQGIDNLLRQTIAEVFVVSISAHVVERKYGNRRLRGCGVCPNAFQRGFEFS